MSLAGSVRKALSRECTYDFSKFFPTSEAEWHREIKFPGICEDAKALGVSRIHLYLVLTGQRMSHRLTSRYNALQQRKAA